MTAEEMLVKKAKSGDDKAFSEIVRLYQNAVYNSALYIAKNRDDALDIAQEVFLKLWRTLGSFRGEVSLKSWIARITRTCAIDYVRQRNAKNAFSLNDEEGEEKSFLIPDDDVESNPEKSYERKEMAKAVRQAVDSLDEPIKETLVLREFHNLSYTEISKTLDVSEGTVKSRISRGREQIKIFLKNGNFL